jgi:hypothetical protein
MLSYMLRVLQRRPLFKAIDTAFDLNKPLILASR